jgi:DNA-binding NarL/FixJ family response regulator
MKETPPIRIVLADDHAITREGIRLVFAGLTDQVLVGEAADGDAAVRLVQQLKPDILLLDINLPGRHGLQVARWLRTTDLKTRIVILTGYDSESYVAAARRLGVHGFISKVASAQELIAAIRLVARGLTYYPTEAEGDDAAALIGPRTLPTPTERLVLGLVAEGHSNRSIAQQLGLSARTVQFHLSNLFAKAQVKSRTGLVHVARDLEWLS